MDSTEEPVFPKHPQLLSNFHVERRPISDNLPEEFRKQPQFAWQKIGKTVHCNVDDEFKTLRITIELLCCDEARQFEADSMQCQGAIIQSDDLQTINIWMAVWYKKEGELINEDELVGEFESKHVVIYTYTA